MFEIVACPCVLLNIDLPMSIRAVVGFVGGGGGGGGGSTTGRFLNVAGMFAVIVLIMNGPLHTKMHHSGQSSIGVH